MTEQELRELIRSQLADINEGKKLKLDIEVPIRWPEFKRFRHNYLLLNKKYSIFKAPEYSMTFGENKWKKETHWKHDSDNNIIYVNDASVVDLLLKGGAPSDLFESNTINENKGRDLDESLNESVLRGQLAGDSASDMADLLRRYGVKQILKQPNDSVTYFHLNNASQGKKIVIMLKKMFGIEAQIDNHMYSPSPAVKFDNDQIVESKLTEMKNPRKVFDYSKLTFSQIERLEDLYAKFTKGDKPEIANESVVNEYMDINDPVLVAIRALKTEIKKAKAAPKKKKISTRQYYKLMDKEIDLIDQMRDATKEFEQLDSDMNQEAGQKGDSWSDDDANRYGGELDRLQTKIEKLAKQKAKVKDDIMNYRIN